VLDRPGTAVDPEKEVGHVSRRALIKERAPPQHGRSPLASERLQTAQTQQRREAAVSVARRKQRRRRPNGGQVLSLAIVGFATIAATTIIVITQGTSGLADLATLILIVSAVVVPRGRERDYRNR